MHLTLWDNHQNLLTFKCKFNWISSPMANFEEKMPPHVPCYNCDRDPCKSSIVSHSFIAILIVQCGRLCLTKAYHNVYMYIQSDTSGCGEPPVDIITKVLFWPGQSGPKQIMSTGGLPQPDMSPCTVFKARHHLLNSAEVHSPLT